MHVAGLYPPGVAARLAHLADAVLEVQALRDDSGLVRLAADPARRARCAACRIARLPHALGCRTVGARSSGSGFALIAAD